WSHLIGPVHRVCRPDLGRHRAGEDAMRRFGAPVIAGAVSVVVVLVVLFALVVPKVGAVGSKKNEVSQAKEQEQKLRLQLTQLQAAERQAPQERAALARLQAAIPPTADLPGLIRLLTTAGQQA